MAVTQATLLAERWLDEVLVFCSIDNVAVATLTEQFILPAGLGDVAILSALVRIVNVGTVPATATVPRGVELTIVQPASLSTVDLVGAEDWSAVSGDAAAFTGFSAHVDPEALCLWRQSELLNVQASEMDLGATGDLRVFVKCVRVRPIEAPASTVIQLVR